MTKGCSASTHSGSQVADRALAWLEKAAENREHPFFAWVHFYDAHAPYTPPEPYRTRYQAEPYDGEIAYTDSVVGKLLGELRARNLFDASLIAVMADHGEAFGEHGEKHHGIFLYDETIRVPLAVLTAQGASTAEAMTYAAMIDRYILGSALQDAEEARMSREHGLDDEATLRSAMNAVHDLAAATGRLPRLTSWLAHPAGPPPEEQFSLGLGFLLDGIARCLTMAENPARSDTIGP